MKLVAGLGNPGRKYQGTRHNIGYEVVAAVARQLAAGRPRERFDGELVDTQTGGERLLLLCPTTFMNLSGKSVGAARDFFQLPNSDVLVVCDDFQLPLGRLRFRPSGSGGGQKGLEDVIRRCGPDVPRLRIGIGPVPPQWNPADFVLGKFTAEETRQLEPVVQRAASAVIDWVTLGTARCMNQYNGPPDAPRGTGESSDDKE